MPAFSRRYTEASPTRGFGDQLGTQNSVPFSQHLTEKRQSGPRSPRQQQVYWRNSSCHHSQWEILMLKFVILGVASLAFVGTAVAADLPRPEPQPAAAPVGKYPLGKYPVGKSPVGKYPVAAPAPLVTKG